MSKLVLDNQQKDIYNQTTLKALDNSQQQDLHVSNDFCILDDWVGIS